MLLFGVQMTPRHNKPQYFSKGELKHLNQAPPLRELMTYRRFKGRVKAEGLIRGLAVSAVCQRPKHCPSQCTAKNCICACHRREGSR